MTTRSPLSLAGLLVLAGLAGCLGAGDGAPFGGSADNDPGFDANGSQPDAGFSSTDVFPGDYNTTGQLSQPLRPGPHEVREPELVRLESPLDGVPIALEVHRPAVSEEVGVPVILVTSPYYEGNTPPGAETYAEDHAPRGGQALAEDFVPHGHAVALLALRGTADSGGCWDTLGPRATADIDHAIDWLADQDWSTGHVGALGLSQDAAAAWQAAATGNEHLGTIVPMAGWADHYGALFRNGTRELLADAFLDQPIDGVEGTEDPHTPQDVRTTATRGLCPSAARMVPETLHALYTGEPGPSGFWEERDLRDEVASRYDGSVFVVHGFQDPLIRPHNAQPFVAGLEDGNTTVKQLLGQWGHARPDGDMEDPDTRRWDFAEILLHWFDHWLEPGVERDLGPRVQVQDTRGDWRSADAWPPAEASPMTLNLHPDGTLSPDASGDASTRTLQPTTSDAPTDAGLQFATDRLDELLRFAESPLPHLRVTPSGAGGTIEATLFGVGPDGDRQQLTSARMDLRFAEGGREADQVTPGEPLVAEMSLEPQDAAVPAGGYLELEIRQLATSPDRFGPTPTEPGPAQGQPAPLDLHLGEGQSTLALETFTVEEQAAFDPPGVDG